MGGSTPKQYQLLAGRSVLRRSVSTLLAHPRVTHVHVVVAEAEQARAAAELADLAVTIGKGGSTRQQSVLAGLQQIVAAGGATYVLVHDAARPLVPLAMISRLLEALDTHTGACPALPVVDSLRKGVQATDNTWVMDANVPRDTLWRIQTPQAFHFDALLAAHRNAPAGATDDGEILRRAGHEVALVEGDERAMKLTRPGDFETLERLMNHVTISGQGFDVHRFCPGDHLWLCGVRIPFNHGLAGHSDADVGLHALTDALFGALGDGDIGSHFPPSDPQWKGAASSRFLAHAAERVTQAGGRILHCDITLICEAPKIGPWRQAMQARVQEILAAHAPRISIKATTTERLGFAGRGEGIAAMALATISLPL